MAKEIKCDVDTCVHYKNHKCDAKEIAVSKSQCDCASATCETECDTFKLK